MANLIGNLQGAGEAVGAVGKTVIDIGKGIKTLLTGKLDPETQNKIDLEWANLDAAAMAQQSRINEIEAQSTSVFVSGWRPALGWTLTISLMAYYLPRFLIGITLWVIQVVKTGVWTLPPDLGIGDVIGLVVPMLGLSGLRTYEKVKSVQGSH